MHRGHQPEIPGHLEIMDRNIHRRIMRPQYCRSQAEEAARASLEQTLQFRSRMRHLPKTGLARFRIRLWRAMKKRGADAGLQQSIDGGVVMGGSWIVMTPVH